jgi:voltage-gated potassium channel
VRAGRERRADWLARLERWTNLPLTLLAVILVPVLLTPYVWSVSDGTRDTLTAVGYLIWGAFAADLAVKLAIAPDRLDYVRRHWVDVALVALPMLRPLRAVRAVRLLRLGWAIGASARVLAGLRRLLARRGLGYVLLAALIVVGLAAALAQEAERDVPEASIRSYPDALWWAVTTVTTVGYGDTYPVTAAGRGVGVALMLLGIALFGLVTASLAALFVEEQEDAVLTELRAMDERVRRIEAAIVGGPLDRSARSPGASSQLANTDRGGT